MKTFHLVNSSRGGGWLRLCFRPVEMSVDELLVWIGWFSRVIRGYVAAYGMRIRAATNRPLKPGKE